MNPDIRIEQHARYLQHFAFKVRARMAAAGVASVQLEDIYQECCIAWCIARDSWDAEKGIPFIAYLTRGMRNHVNRWVKKEIFEGDGSHLALDAQFGDDDGGELHDCIADPGADMPEDIVVAGDYRRKMLGKLSPRARQFLELCESPPKGLVEVVRGLAARRNYALERGLNAAPVARRVTTTLVFQFMGCSRVEITKITAELEKTFKLKSALAAQDRTTR